MTEIYASILGESTHAGRPCVLARFTGCSLRCRYCDTAYAFSGGVEMSPREVAGRIRFFGHRLVLLTGGEPLEQPEIPDLVSSLLESGRELLVETGGHVSAAHLDPRVIKILDIKCPGSGSADSMAWENIGILGPRDEVKFVLTDRRDYEWAREVRAARLRDFEGAVLFSAARGFLTDTLLAEWILEDGLEVRLQVQLHRVLWPDRERGV